MRLTRRLHGVGNHKEHAGMGRHSAGIAAVLLALATAVSACGGGTPSASPTASTSATAAVAPTKLASGAGLGASSAMARCRLFDVPFLAQVAFARDTVVWGVPVPGQTDSSVTRFASFARYDVRTGKSGGDAWLTAVLGGRYVDDWLLAGNAVAWTDTTRRVERADGTLLIGTRVELARRPSPAPSPLTGTSWGLDSGSSTSNGYDAGAWLSDFDGRLCAFYTNSYAPRRMGEAARPGAGAGLWVVDTLTGRRLCIEGSASRAGIDVLAMTGDTVYWAARLTSASDFGSRDIWARSLSTQAARTRHLRAPLRATTPAAADRSVLAFTSTPPNATDSVDAHVWIYTISSGRYRRLSGAPNGQQAAAIGHGFAIWVDGRRTTPGHPIEDLYGYDLAHGHEFRIALNPSGASDPQDVTLCGDELFWTMLDASTQTVYGARLVCAGEKVMVEPL